MSDKGFPEWEEMEQKEKEEIKKMFSGGNLTDLVVRKRDKMVVPRLAEP